MTADFTIVTWNVNSVRMRIDHLVRFLVEWRPDVVCLQETKVTDDLFPTSQIQGLGYQAVTMGQKTYNGVAILSRHAIEEPTKGFDGSGGEEQKRLLAATVLGVRVINAYFPNGNSVGSEKFAEKMRFYQQMKSYLDSYHHPGERLVLVGDFNVAPAPEDVYDPEKMEGRICYHPDERAALENLRKWGFSDQFRKFDTSPGNYTWWDYREGAYPRNAGLRIDHIWATAELDGLANACLIEREERGLEKASDHVPVIASFSGVTPE